jgi:hypothetical protein
MSERLLRRYVKALLETGAPNQLLAPADPPSTEDEGSEVQEFSGAGAVAGYVLPLGMSPSGTSGSTEEDERSRKRKQLHGKKQK